MPLPETPPNTGREILLATEAKQPDLHHDDRLLLNALLEKGLNVRPAVWENPHENWSQASLCVVRSCWDYVPKYDAFKNWVSNTGKQTTLLNPPEVILWNIDKTYLRDLESQGVRIVPTIWIESGERMALGDIFSENDWDKVVIKPVISASGMDTLPVSKTELATGQLFLDNLSQTRDVMIQPYLNRIETEGELSLIFIEKQFTDAIRKTPKQGEFRSQEEYGSQLTNETPPDDALKVAKQIISLVNDRILYARVDLMRDADGNYCLSELELIEPSLYLRFCPRTLDALTNAIATRCKTQTAIF